MSLLTPTRRLDVIVLSNFLALGIIISAVPRYLHGQLHASRFETGLATTIYFVAALLVRPFIGAAVDSVGRRPFIVAPPIVLAGLTTLYTLAHSVPAVAALRFFGGGFAALFFTSVALAATDLAPPEKRTVALSRQSVMTYTGFVVGPIVADRLIRVNWTVVWLVPALLHALTTVLALPMLETRTTTTPIGARRVGFDRRVLRPAVGILVANFTFATIVSFLPEYAERHKIAQPGALFAVYAVSVLSVRLLTGRIADRLGPALFTVPSMFIGGSGLVLLSFAQVKWQSFAAIAVVGGSLGATFPSATAAALGRVGNEERGAAMGTALGVGDIGQATAGPLVGYLSQQWGFRWVYLIPSLLAFVGVSLVVTMPEVRAGRARLRAGRASS